MFADSVIEGSSTTGTGTFTLSGAVFSGKTFAQAFPSGGRVAYFAQTADKSKWEFGYGTLTIGPPRTLTRTIIKSSNSDTAIDWQASDVYYVFSIASADVLNDLLAGNLANGTRPWHTRQGGKWWDYAAGLSVSWAQKLYNGTADVLTGLWYDAVKGLIFTEARRPWTAVGAANKTVALADAGGRFTYNTTASARTCTLPAGSTVKDGFTTGQLGLDSANGIVLTPDAGDAIDYGSNGATLTIPGKIPFSITWDGAGSKWRTSLLRGGAPPTIASAATVVLDGAVGGAAEISGTTTITAITLAEGSERWVRFQGVLTLTNGASLINLSAANIVTVAGDFAKFRGYASGVVRMVAYSRASGAPLGGGSAPFCANKNGTGQTITTGSWQKLTFTTKEFDVGSYYDAANSKWTPPAGKRLIIINVTMDRSASNASYNYLAIYKNGSLLKESVQFHYGDRNTDDTHHLVAIVDANGTDYFEAYTYINSTGGGNVTVNGAAALTFWCGQ